jgi:uncharacterized protein (TIRG00374 family)
LKRFFISIFITAAVLFLLFTQISIRDLYTLLTSIDPLWTVLGVAGYFFAIFFRALRYKWLIHSKDVPFSDLFRISTFHNLSLMVLPSKLGELSYPYLLNKISGMSMTEGLASLIASRVYDFFLTLIFFLVASVSSHALLNVNLFLVVLLSVSLIGLTFLAFFYMPLLLRWFSNALNGISQWIGLKNRTPIHWLQVKLHEMGEDFYAIRAKGTYLSVTLASLISWVMAFWMFYAFLRGFGIDISFMRAVFGSTIALITSALPVGGLGNWGTLEVGWAAGFLLVGLSKEKAIATGLGVHILIFITSALLGLICWITLPLSLFRRHKQ